MFWSVLFSPNCFCYFCCLSGFSKYFSMFCVVCHIFDQMGYTWLQIFDRIDQTWLILCHKSVETF